MKKIITVLCLAGLILASAGCGKDEEKKVEPTLTPGVVEIQEEIGIENGGEIDDEGNVVKENESEGSQSEETVVPEVTAETGATVKPEATVKPDTQSNDGTEVIEDVLELEYDGNGNITKQSAVNVLQQYTSEQLGLTPNISHQLLFDAATSEVNGKECYVIAAKVPDADTEGVFYVSLDGTEAYKYDLENHQYIKLP